MVHLRGFWEVHPEHGEQFRVTELNSEPPREQAAVGRYLAANVSGLGAARARRVTTVLGPGCLDLLQEDPARIELVFSRTLGRQLRFAVERWAAEARRDTKAKELTVRLLKAGVRYGDVRKIMGYSSSAEAAEVATLRHPYRLVEVPGLGWALTDRIAQILGASPRDPRRAEAACRYTLDMAMEQGHSGLPAREIAARAAKLTCLAPTDSLLTDAVGALDTCGMVVDVDGIRMLPEIAQQEWRLAERLAVMMRVPHTLTAEQRQLVGSLIAGAGLSGAQQNAVWLALDHGVAVLSGRPGSGKTTTLKTYIAACRALGWSVQVVAPTGKAASRAAAVTLSPASTVHRLLGGAPESTAAGRVTSDVVIVDESSMCDLATAEWLVSSINPRTTRLLWTGDSDQLPSVQHGCVLHDLIKCGAVPVAQLTQVFRQSEGSRIITNAHRLLDHQSLLLDDAADWRTVLLGPAEAGASGAGKLLAHVRSLMAQSVSPNDIQVLAPMRRGALGVDALNERLQAALNPHGAAGPTIGGGVRVRVGDRVVMTRNCYDLPKPIYNGEQGIVVGHDAREATVTVKVDDRTTTLRGVQRLMLRLAWAMTVHRSQGSEYAHCVLAYDHRAHAAMLDPAVLYTAITRAKECFHLVGTSDAVNRTSSVLGRRVRYTGLASQIRTALALPSTAPEVADAA
jgi:ATP-dependent exoDNAse (exonuclease V), alpha subunit - helicase superfamily I member